MRGRAALGAALIAALASGCGLVSSSGTFESTTLTDDAAPLDGASLVVTSKSFTEGVLLGKITATYLAAAGANVTDLTGAPGSASSRQAQLNGDADILWEYTGTGWVNYHGETETITDPDELWQRVHDIEKQDYDLEWLPPANFNDTYAFAASAGTAERLGVTSLSDVAQLPIGDRTFCVDDEFFSRADGFVPMLETYGIPLNAPDGVPSDQVTRMDAGVVYTSTAQSAPCNFGMVYTTDGRVKNLNLTVLDDDRKFFLPYSGTAVVRGAVLEQHPEIADLMAVVSERLNDDLMQELNGRVDIDGEDPADVAYDWLRSEGLVN
ncbi:glycine betaine ABC transporter substrate-binding protein [Rhodococcus sp. BP-252]|uniref:Glycine/betaine ABC transporter substrate-binding protein n=1 Tax=Rhodococcoides kyotonense TaxID=398843 RepID=A0A177YGV2_9NOCA|nr:MULTISPECIES: glycine betaine ABC transporter substrate-binding protein [Rhodococcus]MBY6412273.1 glycine betaine ABC transporter substrate-binding protein [Rhodococcus sp. BP-320]MBY6416853.1 glycine betaine ABC transporter substrate-binding protein [Rhodococcus sp. BP-321]MBY6421609.1 glycine betaine ABC transporter substrate-binding protein [Rhodococcus sp. BP-324]MBY6426875.1 glycine betaine ABC transporter substrate-binding protein [Rhodococcus sp. BP-323]MBY6432041.1 glycine betaine A